jgi:hypothetical protein
MTLPVVFRRRFQHDLAAGYDWYQAQRIGLGEARIVALRVLHTARDPRIWPRSRGVK